MNRLARRLGIRRWTDVAWLVGSSAWVLLTIGFFLRAQAVYPLLDGNDPVYIRTVVLSMAIVSVAMWLMRRRIFTGEARQPLLMWTLILGMAVTVTFAALGSILFVNGAFDRGSPVRRMALVVSEVDEPKNRHYMLTFRDAPGISPVKLELKAREALVVPVGGQVALEVMPGRLGRPWVRGHAP
jgi:hypothetical protein